MIISIVLRTDSFWTTSLAIFSAPWITVVWSLLPRALPTAWSGAVVIWRHRYMAICLGWTMFALRFEEIISSYFTLKWSATVWMISSGVISFLASGDIRSLSVCSASESCDTVRKHYLISIADMWLTWCICNSRCHIKWTFILWHIYNLHFPYFL